MCMLIIRASAFKRRSQLQRVRQSIISTNQGRSVVLNLVATNCLVEAADKWHVHYHLRRIVGLGTKQHSFSSYQCAADERLRVLSPTPAIKQVAFTASCYHPVRHKEVRSSVEGYQNPTQ